MNIPLEWGFKGNISENSKATTCCFTGHRDIPLISCQKIYSDTLNSIKELVGKGVNKFICGGAMGYDLMCGEIVLYIKERNPHISLEVAVPCKGQDKKYSARDKQRYRELLSKADKVTFVNEEYTMGCYHKRNRYMVDNSSYIIAYCTKPSGGSYYTLDYARKMGVEVINNE